MTRNALFLIGIVLLVACNDGETLKSIEVFPLSGKAGDEITITGIRFKSTLSENVVTFNGVQAIVLSASSAQLLVQVPIKAGDGEVTVKVGNDKAKSEATFDYIESHIVYTLAGSTRGFSDGQGTDAKFGRLGSVDVDADGNVFASDPENQRIRKITPSGLVSTLAGSGEIGYAEGQGALALFTHPTGIDIDLSGNIYLADLGNHKIRKITPSGLVSFFAGSSFGFNDGPSASAKFEDPAGVAVGTNGDVFVVDVQNGRIRKIAAGDVSTFAGSGTKAFADGQGAEASFFLPQDIAIDADGNLYIADTWNHRIRKITPAGLVSTLAGSTEGFADGTGVNAQFKYPVGIAVDADGNVYVADSANHRIRKITSSGEVSTLAGGNGEGDSDGPGGMAQFNFPFDVAIDSDGTLYVADTENRIIRKIVIE